MTKFPVAMLVALATCCSPLLAQTASAAPALESVSVKVTGVPRQPGDYTIRGGPGTNDPTRFTYTHVNLEFLLMRAYGVRIDQISAPDWIKDSSDDRTMYTITAVVPPGTSKDQFNVMLQHLLAERFHLTLHHSTKEYPGYELQVAEGGPKIRLYVPSDNTADASGPAPDDGFPPLGISRRATSVPKTNGGWGMVRSRNRQSMADFARSLGASINESSGLERDATIPRVTDKTGLAGVYEFTLGFAGIVIVPGAVETSSGAGAGDPGEVGPTLFNAMEKQLGLKLVKVKNVAEDILVIDHADKVPTEN